MTGRCGRLFDGCIVHLSTAYNCKCATKAYSYNFKGVSREMCGERDPMCIENMLMKQKLSLLVVVIVATISSSIIIWLNFDGVFSKYSIVLFTNLQSVRWCDAVHNVRYELRLCCMKWRLLCWIRSCLHWRIISHAGTTTVRRMSLGMWHSF